MGANIVLIARNPNKLQEVLAELDTSCQQQHDYLVADFTDTPQLISALDEYLKQERPCHILVNNTGGPPSGLIAQAQNQEFLNAFQQHLIANHTLAQALIPIMKQNGYGRIINIISTSVKQPLQNLGVSNTVRAAVANWSKTLATELAASNITVNNVLPGATETDRLSAIIQAKANKTGKTLLDIEKEMKEEIPARRFAHPEEIAQAVAFLASPAASYITGINLPVDGGRTGCL
jgi:3-oxoacyl-[acyl-carrier protein] reductase